MDVWCDPYDNPQASNVIANSLSAFQLVWGRTAQCCHPSQVVTASMPQASTTTQSLPGCRRSGTVSRQPETDIATDPDNIPPRSRLFMVVPKTADGSIIEVSNADCSCIHRNI